MKIRELQKQDPKARLHALVVSAILCYSRGSSYDKIAAISDHDAQILNSPYHRANLCYDILDEGLGHGYGGWWDDFGEQPSCNRL